MLSSPNTLSFPCPWLLVIWRSSGIVTMGQKTRPHFPPALTPFSPKHWLSQGHVSFSEPLSIMLSWLGHVKCSEPHVSNSHSRWGIQKQDRMALSCPLLSLPWHSHWPAEKDYCTATWRICNAPWVKGVNFPHQVPPIKHACVGKTALSPPWMPRWNLVLGTAKRGH